MELMSGLAKGREEFVIDDYPEYGETLDGPQQAILRKVADAIVAVSPPTTRSRP